MTILETAFGPDSFNPYFQGPDNISICILMYHESLVAVTISHTLHSQVQFRTAKPEKRENA